MPAQRRDQCVVVLHDRPRADLHRDLETAAGAFRGRDRGVAGGIDLGVGGVGEDDDRALADGHVEVGGEPSLRVDDVELGALGGRHQRHVLLAVLQDPARLQQMQQGLPSGLGQGLR